MNFLRAAGEQKPRKNRIGVENKFFPEIPPVYTKHKASIKQKILGTKHDNLHEIIFILNSAADIFIFLIKKPLRFLWVRHFYFKIIHEILNVRSEEIER